MSLRVAHVLNSRGRGGVPHVANALIRRAEPGRIQPHVYYLKPGGGPDLTDDIDIPRGEGKGGKSGAMIGLVNWLSAHRIDILHTHSYRPNIYGRMAGAVLCGAGLRIVAHYHNDYSDKWRDHNILGAERRLAGITDAAIAVSEAVADHVAALVPGIAKIDVVENGLDRARLTGDRDVSRRDLGLEAGHVAIGLVGRVCYQKGIDTFVEAAMALAPRHPQARFLIFGDVEDRGLHMRLAKEIDAARLNATIRFAGHREDVGTVFSALDLVTAPSRWEGFGLVLAEAMYAGLPVVAARVGGIPSVVGDAARLIPPDQPVALARELADLITDRTARSALGRAGQRRAARFDWDRAARQVEIIYHRIVGHG